MTHLVDDRPKVAVNLIKLVNGIVHLIICALERLSGIINKNTSGLPTRAHTPNAIPVLTLPLSE